MHNKGLKFKTSQRGLALFLTTIVLTVILAITLGISGTFISQTKTLKDIGNSVIAFYAADTGIEHALFLGTGCCPLVPPPLPSGATYSVQLISSGPTCLGFDHCLESLGTYQETRRAIKITR